MSWQAKSSSKSIKFQPMPMAALIANLKTLPASLNNRDSSDSSDESNSSIDKISVYSENVQKHKTVPADAKGRDKVPLAENRSAVKSIIDKKIDQTPCQVDRVRNKENSGSRSYRFPRVDVLPTIEASATTSQQSTTEALQSAQKRLPFPEKKDSARCLFPEPAKDPSPPKELSILKEPPTPKVLPALKEQQTPKLLPAPKEAPTPTPKALAVPKEPPTPKVLPVPKEPPAPNDPQTPMQAPSNRPVNVTDGAPDSHSFQLRNSSVAATPSQPQGPKTASKIQFKTINIKGKKYLFIKKLGTGGSSEVYKVLEISTSHEYAVKCVDLATDRELAQGYINEVRLLKDLQKSDRVIKLYEYEYDRPNNYLRLVMEAGETDLACFLRAHREGAPPALVLHYWEEMLTAVRQIHEHGIVHADLKPANFLLVSGRLKLIDFGLASAVSNDATSVVRSCGKGTFSYISPEALGGDGSQPFKVSFYSDVWSLGCILYSLIYGHTPFSHLTTMVKLATIMDPKHYIEFPHVENIPPTLITALKACLRYDAHSRPTVTELLQIRYLEPNPKTSTLNAVIDKLLPHITKEELHILTRRIPDPLLEKLRPIVTPQELEVLQRKIPVDLIEKLRPYVTTQELLMLQNG